MTREERLEELSRMAAQFRFEGDTELAARVEALVASTVAGDPVPAESGDDVSAADVIPTEDTAVVAVVAAALPAPDPSASVIGPAAEQEDVLPDIVYVDTDDDGWDDAEYFDDEDADPVAWVGFATVAARDGRTLSHDDVTKILSEVTEIGAPFDGFVVAGVDMTASVPVAELMFADGGTIVADGRIMSPLPAPVPASGVVDGFGVVDVVLAATAVDALDFAAPRVADVDGVVEVTLTMTALDGAWSQAGVDAAMALAAPGLAVLGRIVWDADPEVGDGVVVATGRLSETGMLPAELSRACMASSAAPVAGVGMVRAEVSVNDMSAFD